MRSPANRMVSRALRLVSAGLQKTARSLTAISENALTYARVRYLDFVPRQDDIYVATYPRSGTTLVQMIVHQAISRSEPSFTHISQVSPWFERSCAHGQNMEEFGSPRILKTHLPFRAVPKQAGKYLYVTRNGLDVAVSYFHFYQSHMGFRGTLPQFFEHFIRGKVHFGSWFEHVAGWRGQGGDPRFLFLDYADLVTDLAGSCRRIIEFCEFDTPTDALPEIVRRCGFEFMKQHEEKFDHATEILLERGVKTNMFIRRGQVGDWTSRLAPEQYARFRIAAKISIDRHKLDPVILLGE